MRLLHTADWHLGRLFHNVSLLDDQRVVLDQLIEIVDRDAVDAVLVSGDIFDRAVPPAGAITLLEEVAEHVQGAEVELFAVELLGAARFQHAGLL
ncbi:exonuclease subunit SbcD, partial [Halomonas sp. 707D4]|uniref:metallophosphoesterase family protein n=1 Tax=Halomonas sp. 707D4 TaxID=1904455 RepID=UPI0020A059AE